MKMTGFLTIEDINGTLYSNQRFYWHILDVSKITTGNEDLDEVVYDFCKISRTKRTSDCIYTITVHNPLFAKAGKVIFYRGAVSFLGNITVDGNTVTFSHEDRYGGIPIIYLYMGLFESENSSVDSMIINDVMELTLKELELPQTIRYRTISPNSGIYSTTKILNKGYNFISSSAYSNEGYVFVKLLKTDFQFQCNQTLTGGKVNKVRLGTLADYKPNGALVGNYTPTIKVQYGDEILPVTFDGTDYSFNLDLTDKTETGKIRFTVNVEANEVLNSTSTDVALNSQYQTVNTFDALLTAVTNSDVIRLGANLTATANIPINKSIKIIGNDKTIDLDSHRFVFKEDVEFKAENVVFNNGDTTIIQAKNTKIELTKVTFNNCTSTNYNGLGACIFCDVDVDSLDVTNDYIATLTECTFTNNANCILHGGELTIQKCTLTNNHLNNHNKNNVAFVYQTDGTCLIQNSNIELDYRAEGSGLCSDEETIGFAQAIIMCGETANINGASHSDLQNDNTLPFFELPFNNRGYLNVKYYYPSLEACVQSLSNDNGCCHACSGVDWVFKNNVTVRRRG